ncbi:MAG: FixH family protein [Sphingobacteriales bacterium]|nr:FixH family protein [Sphingobacteriales bacterium]
MNWGNRLLLVFIVFGIGMCYLVYRSMSTHFDLVESDYYKQELRYQDVIDEHRQANALSSPVTLEQKEGVLQLQLPDEMKNKTITGEVYFYCAYDSKKDKKIALKPDTGGMQSFSAGAVAPGNYTVKIKWSAGEKSYYSEKIFSVL